MFFILLNKLNFRSNNQEEKERINEENIKYLSFVFDSKILN